MNEQEKCEISVVMSVYNGQRYLSCSIESILSQTFSNFEFIIVNDASSDSTQDILDRYKKLDRRIKLIKNHHNIGLTESLNRAIAITRGDYIARMDADDISCPMRFEKQIDFLKREPRVGIVGCWYCIIDECGNTIKEKRPPIRSKAIKRALFNSTPIIHPCVLIRKQAIVDINVYDRSLKYAQDRDLFLRIAQSWEFGMVSEILVKYRHSKNSITLHNELEQKKYRIIAMKKALSAGTYPKIFYIIILLQIVSLHVPAPIRKIKNIILNTLGWRDDINL